MSITLIVMGFVGGAGPSWRVIHRKSNKLKLEIKMSNDYEPQMVVRKSRMPALTPEPTPQEHIPTELCFTDEDDFPGWPITLGLMLSAMLACWGLFHVFLWLGRV